MPRRDLREASMFNIKTLCYCLLTLTVLQPRVGIWHLLHLKLSLLDGERFPMPANATQESFLRLFNFGSRPDADKPSFSLVIDEAQLLDCLSAAQITEFLGTCKDLAGEEHE